MQTSTKQTKGALQLKEISIIPITAAAVNQPSGSGQSMADDDSADSLRKKRCTDRYDSSESSDRWVPRAFESILLARGTRAESALGSHVDTSGVQLRGAQ